MGLFDFNRPLDPNEPLRRPPADALRPHGGLRCGTAAIDRFRRPGWRILQRRLAYEIAENAWRLLAPEDAGPSSRYGHSAIYDPTGDRMVISHGFTDDGRFDDTWAFELATTLGETLRPPAIGRCAAASTMRSMTSGTGRCCSTAAALAGLVRVRSVICGLSILQRVSGES